MGKLLYIPEDHQTSSGSPLVTMDDLEKIRVNLMMDIKMMFDGHLAKTPKRWFKSYEIREMLKISYGTLHFGTTNRHVLDFPTRLFMVRVSLAVNKIQKI